jgi:uncharacterized protein (TIGR02145 family)
MIEENYIIDIDNNIYPCVFIGNKLWMTRNLNVSRFINGDKILEANTNEEWVFAFKNGLPAYSYYNNDENNQTELGKLYNYHAINDKRGLAPINSMIPSQDDFNQLINEFGGKWKCERKLKSKDRWLDYEEFDEYGNLTGQLVNGNGNNESGFNGKPSGCRLDSGYFHGIGKTGDWWSTSEGMYLSMFYHINSAVIINNNDTGIGMSVRCYTRKNEVKE